MAWSTVHVMYVYVTASCLDGNTVITCIHKAQNFMLITSFTFRRNQLIIQVLLVFFELAPLVLNLAILEILRLTKVTG